MSRGGAEDGDAVHAEMVGTDQFGYIRDKSGARGRGYGRRDGYGGVVGIKRLGYGRSEVGRETRGTR